MGLWDKLKNALSVPEDDDYDRLDDEEIITPYKPAPEDEYTKPVSLRGREKKYEKERDFDYYNNRNASGNRMANKVVDIHTTAKLQVVLTKPERFDDAVNIADNLNDKRTVVLNLESANRDEARRLVDFLSGVAYANGGQLKRIANSTFIITPYNVDVMGDLLDELESNGVFFV